MSKTRILVADDSSTIQKVFELAFEHEDVEVSLADSGKSALQKIHEFKPDIVIADVNMPEMDGFELCSTIKNDESVSNIPVYLLVSALDEFDEERAKQAGADGKFEKPFTSETMVAQVREAINSSVKPAPEAMADDAFDDVDLSIDQILETMDEKDAAALDLEDESAPDVESESQELVEEGQAAPVEPEQKEPQPPEPDMSDENISAIADEAANELEEELAPATMNPDETDELSDLADEAADELEEELGSLSEIEVFEDTETSVVASSEKDDLLNSSPVLDLTAESVVDFDEDDGDDLEVEVISGDKIADGEEYGLNDTGAVSKMESDESDIDNIIGMNVEPVDDLNLDEVSGGDQLEKLSPGELDEPHSKLPEESTPGQADEISAAPEAFNDIKTDEANAQMNDKILDEKILDAVKVKTEEQLKLAVQRAINEMEGSLINDAISDAVKKAVTEKLSSDKMEPLLATMIQNAMIEMKPQMLNIFKKVAKDLTLEIAEDLVQKTIEQIKAED